MYRSAKDLGRIVKENREGRAMDAARGRELRERKALIAEAKDLAIVDFWCGTCLKDFEAKGQKQVRDAIGWPVAFYAAHCPLGHIAMRRITDKLNDPYFYESLLMRMQQVDHADDFITPDNPRFAVLYPIQWARIENDRKKREEAQAAMVKDKTGIITDTHGG